MNKPVSVAGKAVFRRSMTTATAAQARVETHLDAWFRSLPIGGEGAKVFVNAIIGQVGAALGAAYVVFAPDALTDTNIADNENADPRLRAHLRGAMSYRKWLNSIPLPPWLRRQWGSRLAYIPRFPQMRCSRRAAGRVGEIPERRRKMRSSSWRGTDA